MRCCTCSTPAGEVCRSTITAADLGELIYIQGLDVNLCTRFQAIADAFQFRDCAGNIIAANSQIVTCADFATRLCATLAALADGGEVVLGVTEVVGANCQTYVIPETPLVATDTSTIDFTTGGPFGHSLTGVVRVSLSPGNIITINPDGLYAAAPDTTCEQLEAFPVGDPAVPDVTLLVGADCELHTYTETPITVVDSLTVDLTSSGPFGHTIEADVNISSVVGNQLVLQPDGLYVAAGAAPPNVNVVGLDTPSVDITVTEAPADTFTVSANVVISPNADNALSILPNGLFVNEVELTAGDGDCVEIQVVDNGNGDWTIVADAVISPDFGNSLECRENGLYATTVGLIVTDTDCISLDLVGAELSASAIIDPAPGNALVCGPDGLFVPTGADFDLCTTLAALPVGDMAVPNEALIGADCEIHALPPLIAIDTTTINTTVTYVNNVGNQISSSLILDTTHPGYPAACNGLVADAGGLSAPPDIAGLLLETGAWGAGPLLVQEIVPAGTTTPVPVEYFSQSLVVNNPSTCRSMLVTANFKADLGVLWDDIIPALGPRVLHAFNLVFTSADGGGTFTRAGSVANSFSSDNTGVGDPSSITSWHMTAPFGLSQSAIIPPGGSTTFVASYQYYIEPGFNSNIPDVEFLIQDPGIQIVGHTI